ncbi:Domain of unknown function (DUF1992) [Nesidiocoris tenuis]|uniref:J domain-containing protein n=1 Tax=Nesidiocoris tenuis TaxID=355587 RepID=A0ABN7AJQ7_9HEMI|nr:Domain of unknown function (DUF1992) [Nesidiocoris tenuis]
MQNLVFSNVKSCCRIVICPVPCHSSASVGHQLRSFTTKAPNIVECYRTLGVKNGSDEETVRLAFIQLVKRFHPDSNTTEANASKFNEIELAYRKLQSEFAKKRFKKDECEGEYGLYYQEKPSDCVEQDIQHTAPQHRQYLSNHGYGMGTPLQREKQYAQHRASKAAEKVTEYRVSRIVNKDETAVQVRQEKSKVRDIRTGFGMERLVEDLIQESMGRGEFENLGGKGKPLKNKSSHNPYVDFVTHKLNEVLIDNGFTPQWITLQKEIREHRDSVRENLKKARLKLGPLPLSLKDQEYWDKTVERIELDAKYLNSKIDFYNLVVPILNKQMTHFDLAREADKIYREINVKCEQKITDGDVAKPPGGQRDGSAWWTLMINSLFQK